jgi:tRNA1Val (adenine37-N6)-methyltransferase
MKSSRLIDIELRPGESIDWFMNGRLKLIQSKKGYRFSIDAVFLAQFVTIKKGDRVIDLGVGCGIIPLILLLSKPIEFAVGLEIQLDLAYQTARNALINELSHKLGVVIGDMKEWPFRPHSADIVVCNPPYRQKDSGRVNPDIQRAIARHEILASMDDVLNAARSLLRAKGKLVMIYPAERLPDLMIRLRDFGMEPKRMQVIYPSMTSEAKLALIEASLGGRKGLKILPPLIDQGHRSDTGL